MPVDFENTRKRSHSDQGVEYGKSRIRTLLIHIHGGGFVASTSRGHQHYVRKWTKMIPDCVIMSIDYRLAPENPYPAGLDDICQGYYWIINQASAQLGIYPKNIILTGDSAGGNLAMSLVLRCIHTGMSPPDGLLLAYPALNLSAQAFSPSLLISIDDFVLQFSLMINCMKAYVNKGDPEHDPYISPALIKDEVF